MSKTACHPKIKNTNTSVHSSHSSKVKKFSPHLKFPYFSPQDAIKLVADHKIQFLKCLDENNIKEFRSLVHKLNKLEFECFPFGKMIGTINGDNILHLAAKNQASDVLIYLKEKKVDLKRFIYNKNNEEKYCLYYAIKNKDESMVKFLLSLGDFSCRYIDVKEKIDALTLAVFTRSLSIVKLLVEKYSDIRSVDMHGKSPLTYAKEKGYTEIVDYFDRVLNPEKYLMIKA